MYRLLFAVLLLFIHSQLLAQEKNPTYNKSLADSLGADKYGMKSYIFVLLKSGPNTTTDQEKLGQLFRGHMENIGQLAKEGKLVVAGPFMKNDKSYRGIFILNVKTVAEANELLAKDPAIREKVLEPEILPWYGSAALPLYLKQHGQIEAEKH